MDSDYKYAIQMIAEEMAEEKYGKDFYDLSDDAQYEVYTEASRRYWDRLADLGDYLRKAERERI